MRRIKRFFISFLLTLGLLFCVDRVSASIFGEENAVLSSILLEDIQHTLSLKSMVSFATEELQLLNRKYGYEKWINQGLDQIKDYGFLSELKTDDYILGTFQRDANRMGFKFQGENFQMENIDDWIDQLWDLSPGYLNSKAGLRDKVSRNAAGLALEQYLWNLNYNEKIRKRYEELQLEATNANPGLSNRITAQTNVMQNYQLTNLNDTQNRIMQLMAMRELERLQEEYKTVNYFKTGFGGIKDIYKDMGGVW